MDEEIGIVYQAALEHLGAENIFFVQTADHGAQLPFGSGISMTKEFAFR